MCAYYLLLIVSHIKKRNSDCVAARVDYVESFDSAVCVKHAVSYFGERFWYN